MAAFGSVTLLCLATMMASVYGEAFYRPAYRLAPRDGYGARELVLGGRPRFIYNWPTIKEECSKVHGRQPKDDDLLPSDLEGFDRLLTRTNVYESWYNLTETSPFYVFTTDSTPIEDFTCRHSWNLKPITATCQEIKYTSCSTASILKISDCLEPQNKQYEHNGLGHYLNPAVCIRDVPTGTHILRLPHIEVTTYVKRHNVRNQCRKIGGDWIDSKLIHEKDIDGFVNDLKEIPEWRHSLPEVYRFTTNQCQAGKCLTWSNNGTMPLDFQPDYYRVLPLCHSKITGPKKGDNKCWGSNGHNSEFYIKPEPTQYATTLKEAMYVCSKLGADIPHYFSDKCLRSQNINGAFTRWATKLNPDIVHDIERNLRVNNKRLPIVCQRPVERCLGYGTLFAPYNIPFQLTFAKDFANQRCAYSGGVLPAPSEGYNRCAAKFLGRMQALFLMPSLPKVWVYGDHDVASKHVICYLPNSKAQNMDESKIPLINRIGLSDVDVTAPAVVKSSERTCHGKNKGENSAFLFQPTYTRFARTFTDCIKACTELGADIPHYLPVSCPGEAIFSRDLSLDQVKAYEKNLVQNGQALRVFCQRPLQRCQNYGTLFTPKSHKSNVPVDLMEARRLCLKSLGMVPWQTPGATGCANLLTARLQKIFGLSKQPDVWWEGIGVDTYSKRLVICFLPSSNEVSRTVPKIHNH